MSNFEQKVRLAGATFLIVVAFVLLWILLGGAE